MSRFKVIKTIDLWTEQNCNDIDLFEGAFIDGFSNDCCPYDYYRVILNCNCLINVNIKDIYVSNKHHSVVFYKRGVPVRLVVINRDTDVINCINEVFNKSYDFGSLEDKFKEFQIFYNIVDLKQEPIYNKHTDSEQCAVGSCDRKELLDAMLKGSYTVDDTNIGFDDIVNFNYVIGSIMTFRLELERNKFHIFHNGAYMSENKDRVIPIQRDSVLGLSMKK